MDPDVDLEAYIIIRRSPCPALGKSSGFGTGNVVGKAIDESSALRAKTFLAEQVAAKASASGASQQGASARALLTLAMHRMRQPRACALCVARQCRALYRCRYKGRMSSRV